MNLGPDPANEPEPEEDGHDGAFLARSLRALDGQLGADEESAWNAELAADVEKRRRFVRLCVQARALAEVMGLQRRDAGPLDGGSEDEEIVGGRRAWLPWAITAAACVVAAVSLGVAYNRGPDRAGGLPGPGRAGGVSPLSAGGARPDRRARPDRGLTPPARPENRDRVGEPPGDPVVALLVNEAGAQFAGNAAPHAVRFEAGAYRQTEGTVHLRFTSGADVVIRAPARYRIHDPMHMTLEEGILRAVVPDSAHGFTVAAPGVNYEDLGTEFGVDVPSPAAPIPATADGDRGASELHVFEGRVDLKTPEGRRIARVGLGSAVRVVGGAVGPATVADPDRFPTPAAVGFHRWNLGRESFQADPSLVCYFPFIEDPEDDRLLRDHATHRDGRGVNGRIRGARWVSGRWLGKQALLFDSDGDAVELSLPEPSRQLTLAAWVCLNRLDFVHNAIFNSDGWDPGDFHWQLTRLGEARAGINGFDQGTVTRHGSTVPLGQWVHHAVVIDFDRASIRVYVNGALYKEATAPRPIPVLSFGPGRIGDWLRRPDWEDSPRRGLRGRIDEFAVWGRALPPEEIHALATAGWPSLLSAVGQD